MLIYEEFTRRGFWSNRYYGGLLRDVRALIGGSAPAHSTSPRASVPRLFPLEGFSSANVQMPVDRGYVLCPGPAPDSKTAWSGISKQPCMYLVGGFFADGRPNRHIYVSSTTQATFAFEVFCASSELPAGRVDGAVYLPQYKNLLEQLGLVCVLQGTSLYAIDLKRRSVRKWGSIPPDLRANVRMQFLDDISGPLYVALERAAPDFATRAADTVGGCSRARSLWLVDGERFVYCGLDESAEPTTAWVRGPLLPIPVRDFGVGRVFIRGQNRRFGTTSCAMLYIAGGVDESGSQRSELQCLVADGKYPHEKWSVLTTHNNGSADVFGVEMPPSLLSLPVPLSSATALTELWPEMLVTGARTTVLGTDATGTWRAFFAGWRFAHTSFGTDDQWSEIPVPLPSPAADIGAAGLRLVASCPIDQQIPGHSTKLRNSRFFLEFAGRQESGRVQSILSIPAVTSFPSVEVVRGLGRRHAAAAELAFLFGDQVPGANEWKQHFASGTAHVFPSPQSLGGVDCPGFQRVFVGDSQHADRAEAYTLLYANAWLGKFILPAWGAHGSEQEEAAFVINKFTPLGHATLRPECAWSPGVELPGKIVRGASVYDDQPCFVLRYGCQSSRAMLPTIPPVPTAAIRDELRWFDVPGGPRVLWGLTFLSLSANTHVFVLGFILYPTGDLGSAQRRLVSS